MRLILLLILSLPSFALEAADLPAPDAMGPWLAGAGVPAIPPSEWSERRRERYRTYLADSRFEVLVVPAQIQKHAVDQVARAVITRRVAAALRDAGWRVAPVDPVRGALGEFTRVFDRDSVAGLAGTLRASTVVETFVGHDAGLDYPKLTVSVIAYENTPAGLRRTGAYHREGVQLSDVETPERVFDVLLPDALGELGLDRHAGRSRATRAAEPHTQRVAVPESLGAMVATGNATVLHRIRYWQLLGGLLPRFSDYERNRFFERSLVAARALPADSKAQKLVRAWAHYYLYRRPLGLHTLQGVGGYEADFLRAALLGDAVGMGNALSGIDEPVPRLLATVEWIRLARRYDLPVSDRAFDALTAAYPEWDLFLRVRLDDVSTWQRMRRMEMNVALQAGLPAPDATPQRFLEEVAVKAEEIRDHAGAPSPIGKLLATIEEPLRLPPEIHLQTLRDRAPPCCAGAETFSWQDVHAFLEAQVHAYRWELIYWELFTRSRADAAMEIVDHVGLFYVGHHMWEYLRGMAALNQARGMEEAIEKRQKVGEYRFFRARSVMLAPGMSGWLPAALASWESDPYRDEVLAKRGDSEAAVRELGTWLYSLHEAEFPRKPYAPTFNYQPDAVTRELVYQRQSLRYVTADPDRYFDWIRTLRDEGRGEEALARLADSPTHFRGSAGRARWQARAAFWNVGLDAALESLLMDIAAGVGSYDITHLYADYLASAGRHDEALRVLGSHPRVQAPLAEHGGIVDYANTQAHVARHFLSLGEPALAVPFYQRAATTGSGASSEITSRLILARMADQWPVALTQANLDYERYPSHAGAQERIEILHIMGRHEQAQALFEDQISQAAGDGPWTASAIGHKIRGSAVIDMVAAPSLARLDLSAFGPQARRWLFVTQVIDRVPSADVVVALDTFADPPMATAPHSEPAYFARIVAALRAGDPAQAARLCGTRTQFYDFLGERSYAAPYCGYALLVAGHRSEVQAMLDERLSLGRKYLVRIDFNGRMLAALLHGFAGEADAALQELELAARRHGAFGTSWMHEDHTLLTVAEWLAGRLDDPRFTGLAVQTARGKADYMPGLGFYPAFLALHGSDPDERAEAAGRALHLDPRSYWLSQVPVAIRDEGVDWLARDNPYGLEDTWSTVEAWLREWI